MSTVSSSSSVDLSLSGLASGLDWKTLVSQLANAERAPETQWKATQSNLAQQNISFSTIKSQLTSFQSQLDALKDTTLYSGRTVQTSNSAVATATADPGAALGSYSFQFKQLATTASWAGTSNVAQALSPDGNLGNVTLGTAGFSTAITAGTFTVDGKQVTIATTDSLQSVFDDIAKATNNNVTASYDSGTDQITLTSADQSEIILGSATDSSNFLQAAHLYNHLPGDTGLDSIQSTVALGGVRVNAALTDSDLATPVKGDAKGNGQFQINGVTINYNINSDGIQNILDRINNSAAGVTASYDSQNDRFSLVNKTTGDVGVSMGDVSGNFLKATGLSDGSLNRGLNLLYTVNGGKQLVSQSNTITSDSSGLTGLSVTALAKDTASAVVGSDTSSLQTAVQNFVNTYNTVQSYIAQQTASSTDSTGKVTAGLLTTDHTATDISSILRTSVFSPLSGLSGGINKLSDLGIQTNGQDNTLSIKDTSQLNSAISSNLSGLQSFFTDSTNGLAAKVDAYLNKTIGDNGSLVTHETTLTNQSSSIDTQIANLEKTITADSAHWTNEFVAMEQAQSTLTQQLNYLTKAFGSTSSTG